MFRNAILAAGLMCAALAAPASASVTISFAGGSSASTGTSGNIASYSAGALAVQASGWSVNNWTLNPGFLGRYSDGLGVTSVGEDGSLATRGIDNVGGTDFVLLVFNQPVSLLSAVLTPNQLPTGSADNDATVSFATLNGAFTTPTPTLVSTGSPVWWELLANVSGASGNASGTFSTALTPGKTYGNVWAIGADMNGIDGTPDAFRLTSITVSPAAVPEPSTWLMMFVGLAAVAGAARTRSRALRSFAQVA